MIKYDKTIIARNRIEAMEDHDRVITHSENVDRFLRPIELKRANERIQVQKETL
jgi:hypothetical protein